MAEQGSGERTEQPTPRRRLDARRKGTVARSNDLVGALSLLAAALLAPWTVNSAFAVALNGLRGSIAAAQRPLVGGTLGLGGLTAMSPVLGPVAALLGTLLAVGLVANFAQVGFVVSGQALAPSLARLNPLSGFQRLFSWRASFEGLKATGKMLLFSLVAASALKSESSRLTALAWLPPAQASAYVAGLAQTVCLRVGLVWLALAAVDYFFQRRQIDRQLMMTKDELRREMREQEGSPEVKGAQMRRRRQLAKGGLASKLKQADVVVTNPTHYAVAIAYERSKMHSPLVVAKGADHLALRIRELSRDFDVPIVENKPLARSLYDTCEVGDYVPRELFGPVAEVLAYVYRTLKRVRR